MDVMTRIEQTLQAALAQGDHPGCPPKLVAAMRHAVFPRGARIRPRLCLAVAAACGDDAPGLSAAAAAAIELLALRVPGAMTTCRASTTPICAAASLRCIASSASRWPCSPEMPLIVLAFQALAQGAAAMPARLGSLMLTIGRSVGVPCGIVAGQAWGVRGRHRPGALPAGEDGRAVRRRHGVRRGRGRRGVGALAAYRHDAGRGVFKWPTDILDATASAASLGKPVGQDVAHDRPNAVRELGLDGAILRLKDLAEAAVEAVPPCPGRAPLRSHIHSEVARLLPQDLARRAA